MNKADPPRPIPPLDKLKDPGDCEHPWHRVAVVDYKGVSALQCHDCAAYLMVNGHRLTFEFSKVR